MANDVLNLDYETASELDLKKVGLDRYINHPSTRVLMAAWSLNGQKVEQWDHAETRKFSPYLREALESPEVDKWAFNAQFERLVTQRILKLNVPYNHWRCTMCLAYMQGFFGGLAQVGTAMGLPAELLKMTEGQRLIRMFSMPQRVTKNQPYRWRDVTTDPQDYELFKTYNRKDVSAELAVLQRLIKFPIPEREWRLYWLDQKINDRGVMINHDHARNALIMADNRKKEIIVDMGRMTGLSNPGSPVQLLPWLKEHGYPFDDIQKDTVSKVVREYDTNDIDDECLEVLQMRQTSSKISVAKYKAMADKAGPDGAFRFSLQFHGASRTGRWAGRNLQVQNLPRTPKIIEDVFWLSQANRAITEGDFEGLKLLVGEPMNALVGCIRSAIVARPGRVFRVADLSSIESVVIGWLTNCKWFLQTLAEGRDLYRAFAAQWLKLPYDDTKPHRSKAKPATLGAGYRLGGGNLINGKKTGLWGYAENMGVFLSKEESHSSVQAFRDLCPEIVDAWKDLEVAARRCIKTGEPVKVGYVTFEMRKPYLCIVLPSGRRLYYFKPEIITETVKSENGDTYRRTQVSYMGKQQNGNKWVRIVTHGGKWIENCISRGTLVLTDRGWVPIEGVKICDKLWDGLEFVSHKGLVSKGVQPVMSVFGVRMTPDHEVLTDDGWKQASQVEGHNRAYCGLPDGVKVSQFGREKVSMVSAMYMWPNQSIARYRNEQDVEPRHKSILRLHAGGNGRPETENARHEPGAAVCGLPQYAGAVLQREAQGVQELRGPWRGSLRQVAAEFFRVLVGYARGVSTRFNLRTHGQQQRVLQTELPMGDIPRAGGQQAEQLPDRNPSRANDSIAGIGNLPDKGNDPVIPLGQKMAQREAVYKTGRHEQDSLAEVYDILNAGPRQRFVVACQDGVPMIVHNCVQAIARDVLVWGLMRADKDGFDIPMHVHDEIVSEADVGDDVHTLPRLIEHMTAPIPWAKGLPLGAAGWEGTFYRKD